MVGNFWYSGRAIMSRSESGIFANSHRRAAIAGNHGNTIVIPFAL